MRNMTALYARVSTREHSQNPETQLVALRDWASRQNDEYIEYVDLASGKDLNRPEWKRLTADWRAGQIHTIAVLRLDRAFRSVADMHSCFAEWEGRRIRFTGITQPIDTGTPVGKLLTTMLGAVAEFERDLISERVREGLARVKREGKKLGRPRKVDDRRLLDTAKRIRSTRGAAIELGISLGTMSRRVRKTKSGFELVSSR